MYIRTLAGLPLEQGMSQQWLGALQLAKANQAQSGEFAMTPRDLQVEAVESFASLQANWIRRSKEGSLLSHYESKEIATFDPGEPKLRPRAGKTYFYENIGTASTLAVLFKAYKLPTSNRIVVGDAATHKVIASYLIPENLRATVHSAARAERQGDVGYE